MPKQLERQFVTNYEWKKLMLSALRWTYENKVTKAQRSGNSDLVDHYALKLMTITDEIVALDIEFDLERNRSFSL